MFSLETKIRRKGKENRQGRNNQSRDNRRWRSIANKDLVQNLRKINTLINNQDMPKVSTSEQRPGWKYPRKECHRTGGLRVLPVSPVHPGRASWTESEIMCESESNKPERNIWQSCHNGGTRPGAGVKSWSRGWRRARGRDISVHKTLGFPKKPTEITNWKLEKQAN